ncbi:MAG: right-handed parallel beta-helix repeat-containing protein, partial [Ignavibacteriaceae bacterium]|nr:right-handed parallel beta-helix repeat-containing protein [Ignavibacteriaceae bacterium]
LEFSKNNLIQGNSAKNNIRYGLHFMFSDNCSYFKNRFSENGAGVAVMYSSKIEMVENLFFNNKGPASYGLLLKDINQSHVSKNTFSGNTKGIYMEASGRSLIEKNIFVKNGWAIDLMANSMDNQFTGNSFYSNNFDVATNSKQNFNTFTENYWDNYAGYDLNKDGFGDVPYHPVSLFSVIVTEYKPSLILMRGLFTKLLDLAERVFPSLTPKQLIDEKPVMRRIV